MASLLLILKAFVVALQCSSFANANYTPKKWDLDPLQPLYFYLFVFHLFYFFSFCFQFFFAGEAGGGLNPKYESNFVGQ